MDITPRSKLRKTLKKYLPPVVVRAAYKIISFKRLVKYPKFFLDFRKFKKLSAGKNRPAAVSWKDVLPMLDEATSSTDFDAHYIYHPAWAARILAKTKPDVHVDVSSILSFSSIVSAFIPVKFYDYRPANLHLDNLFCGQADLVNLPFSDGEISSLSCMHTVEHVGLGRYGDKLDPDGDLKAMSELKRVLAPGGSLLFAVPIGQPKIQFNGHRIYSYKQIKDYFKDLSLVEFSLIRDASQGGGIVRQATEEESDMQVYGCGCFWFKK